MRPAAMSRARVRVISVTTRPSRQRAWRLLVPPEAVPSRRPSWAGTLEACQAGARPKSSAEMHGGEEEEGEDAGVDVNIFSVKQGTCQVFLKQAESHESDAEAGGGASNGEQQAFREELTGDAAALSPECAADGDFAAAAVGSSEHQSSDVGAGDEPHGEDGPIESEERRTGADGDGVVVVEDMEGSDVLIFGIVVDELAMNAFEFGLRLDGGDAGAQHSNGNQGTGAAILQVLVVTVEGAEDFVAGAHGEGDVRRHNTDDGVRNAIDGDDAADDGGVGMVELPPDAIAEDENAIAIGLRVSGSEGTAEPGMDADYVEEVGSNDDLRGELRIVGSSQGGELEDVPGEALERMAAGRVIAEIGKGEGGGVRALDGFDGDQTRGIGVRKRAEDDLLDDGEHGGVDADAEAEGDDGGEGEGRGFSELSQGETKVLGHRGHARISWVWISNCSAAGEGARVGGSS